MEDKRDPRLDVPAEANREKHINFLDAEEQTAAGNIADEDRFGSTKEDAERREQWQKGLEEGRRNAAQNDK